MADNGEQANAPPVDPGATAPPPMDVSAQPSAAPAAIGGANFTDFTELSNQYLKELQEQFEGVRQRATTASQDAPATIQAMQQQIEPQAKQLIEAITDTQGPASAHSKAVIQTFLWGAILLITSTLVAPLGTHLLGPVVGLFLGRAGAVLVGYITLPIVGYYYVRNSVSDAEGRFTLLGVAAVQGLLVSFALTRSYLVSAPISVLTPLIFAAAYPFVIGFVGNSKVNTLGAVVGGAVGINLLLSMIFGFVSFHYFLLTLLYAAACGVILQLLHKYAPTADVQTHVYQLAVLSSIVLFHGLVSLLFGSATPVYQEK